MSSPNWEEVPDVYLDGRSVLPYPDPDPEFTRGVWERYRADREAKLAEDEPDEDAELDVYKNQEPPVITMEAEEFDEPVSTLAAYVKLAHSNDWDIVELAHSRCTARGKVIQSGERAGQRHPDLEIETQWLKIEKAGAGRAVIAYTVRNGETYSAWTYRSFNGLRRGDKEMKELIKNG